MLVAACWNKFKMEWLLYNYIIQRILNKGVMHITCFGTVYLTVEQEMLIARYWADRYFLQTRDKYRTCAPAALIYCAGPAAAQQLLCIAAKQLLCIAAQQLLSTTMKSRGHLNPLNGLLIVVGSAGNSAMEKQVKKE